MKELAAELPGVMPGLSEALLGFADSPGASTSTRAAPGAGLRRGASEGGLVSCTVPCARSRRRLRWRGDHEAGRVGELPGPPCALRVQCAAAGSHSELELGSHQAALWQCTLLQGLRALRRTTQLSRRRGGPTAHAQTPAPNHPYTFRELGTAANMCSLQCTPLAHRRKSEVSLATEMPTMTASTAV